MMSVLRNRKGVTLVEVMISLVILLIVFMGLIQASLLSIQQNTRTELRDEAVRIASQAMTAAKAGGFIHLNTANGSVSRTFRNAQAVRFDWTRTVTDLDSATKKVTIVISWPYRNESFSHSITSIMTNQ